MISFMRRWPNSIFMYRVGPRPIDGFPSRYGRWALRRKV